MKRTKLWISLLAVSFVILLLDACGLSPITQCSATSSVQDSSVTEAQAEEQEEPEQSSAGAPVSISILIFNSDIEVMDFVTSVQDVTANSDKPVDITVYDAQGDPSMLCIFSEVCVGRGSNAVIIVNPAFGFSDEDLLPALAILDQAGVVAGTDHAIDGAPDSSFVYDFNDASGCVNTVIELISE